MKLINVKPDILYGKENIMIKKNKKNKLDF
jgi:hypothetical protein